MTAANGELEVEAKFHVLDRSAARDLVAAAEVDGLPGIGAPRRVRQLDRYIDTGDGRCLHAGWAVRLRAVDGTTRLELKRTTPPGSDGIQRRTELDGPAGPGDDPETWPRSAARRRLLQLAAGGPLETTVTLRQDRLMRDFGNGVRRIVLSLDRTAVLVGDAVVDRLTVLEVEQGDGDAAGFERALAAIRLEPFLTPSTGSKLAWAMALTANRTRADALPAIAAEDEPLHGDDPTAEVGRRILRAQLRRLLDRERAFLAFSGPEEIRKMRVATRRLRATWRAFGSAYEGRLPDRLKRRLGRLGDALSAVRDLDVLLGRVEAARSEAAGPGALPVSPAGADVGSGALPAVQAAAVGADDAASPDAPVADGLAGLVASIEARRASNLAALETELASPRHRRWLDEFVEFVETPGRGAVPVRPPAPRLAREQVGGWIWSGFERLLAWAPLIEIADPLKLHEMRLEAKRLRDVIQVAEPLASRPAPAVVASLVRLQDALGAMNDAMVTAATCRAFLASGAELTPLEVVAVERFGVAQERAVKATRRRVPAAWRAATGPTSRRRLGRFLGDL